MQGKPTLIIMFSLFNMLVRSQTGVGIGFYPTGTETGIGFRSGKNSTACLDARVTKANLFSNPEISSFLSELSIVLRIIKLEKLRLHIGLGGRSEWNIGRNNKYGGVAAVGVEAFPFPFQNAGLFFEAAPFFTHDMIKDFSAGLRTVAGFVFYIPAKGKTEPSNQ